MVFPQKICSCPNPQIRGFSWIIWAGPKFNNKYPYKRHTEETHIETQRRNQYEETCRHWSAEATSQRTPASTRRWKRQGTDSSLEPWDDLRHSQHLDFEPLASRTVNFCCFKPPNLQ